jgi:RNA polymerase sigma-70 factor, ECF subfamily
LFFFTPSIEIRGTVVTATPMAERLAHLSPAHAAENAAIGYLAGSPQLLEHYCCWKGVAAAMLATTHNLRRVMYPPGNEETLNGSFPEPARAANVEPIAESEDQPNPSEPACNPVNWQELVDRIHRGEESGMEDLYRLFARGIRYYLCRQLGPQELDDKVHDTFLIVVLAIRRNELREPERLMGFVRTVVRRQIAAHIDHVVHTRREEVTLDLGVRVADHRIDPEKSAAFHQRVQFMLDVLAGLCGRDREILTRFYLHEQSQEEICDQMNLSETQFRLLKSRAKARFGEIGKRKLQQKPLVALLVRTSGPSVHSVSKTGYWPI